MRASRITQLLAEWDSPYQNSVDLKNHVQAEQTASVMKIRALSLFSSPQSPPRCAHSMARATSTLGLRS